MGYFFAEFDHHGAPLCMIRKHTRVYYHRQDPPPTSHRSGRCIGVVWMGHPGSVVRPAEPTPWAAIAPDQTLRAVHHLYERAVLAKTGAEPPGATDYLLVLHCYYSVDPNAAAAYTNWRASKCHYKERIPKTAKFVVAAWGADKPYSLVYQSMKKINRAKKKGSVKLVVYVDPPVLPKSRPRISKNLRSMNYPAHLLNRHFMSNAPKLALLLAPFV